VDIPGGTFQMGCSPGDGECQDDERPVHTVSIKPFRMGKYEVTVGQFRRFVEAAGYRTDAERGGNCWTVQADGEGAEQAGRDWRSPGFPQSDRDPVACVSWNDTQAYTQWLSQKGAGRYRLPSESEWEYATRAGGNGRYSFGDSEGMLCQYGNIADRTAKRQFSDWDLAASCNDGALYTAPVGGYRPNRFGLHDMQGNVWEWTEDCYHDSYAGAPSDGASWTAGVGDCAQRVSRGGSWNREPRGVRSSFRNKLSARLRNDVLGFRLLQDR
jgi:formylglycine-generating enzyme required for sulfatase activity